MKDNLNKRQSQWKTTLKEDNLMEDEPIGRLIQWKVTSMEDTLNGRQPEWKTTSIGLASQLCTEHSPSQTQLVIFSLGFNLSNSDC